jgi:tRNA dimethylallyltransferase
LLAIVGPTAAGKSALAMEVARRVGAVIVSVDSMQAYRGMDIGTAKPTVDERAEIPHEMIDIAEPDVDLTVQSFQQLATERVEAHDRPLIVVGGSGLHFRAIVDPLTFAPNDPRIRAEIDALEPREAVARLLEIDPAAAGQVDLKNPRRVTRALEIAELTGVGPTERSEMPEAVAIREYRPKRPFLGIGLDPGDDLVDRIDRRVDEMMAVGLLDEVASLAPRLGRNASRAVGYSELLDVIAGTVPLSPAVAAIRSNTVSLARRQRTWFRRDPRINWLEPDIDIESAVAYCLERWQP